MYRMVSAIGGLRIADRDAWVVRVRAALDKFGANRAKAAGELGVSVRQLRRWARELGYDKLVPNQK